MSNQVDAYKEADGLEDWKLMLMQIILIQFPTPIADGPQPIPGNPRFFSGFYWHLYTHGAPTHMWAPTHTRKFNQ